MVSPTLPFWMRQRQIVAEPVNEHTVRLTGPILPACEVTVQPGGNAENASYLLRVEKVSDAGKEVLAEATSSLPREEAWQAAFELYRQQVIV
jgi:hypothetical protein